MIRSYSFRYGPLDGLTMTFDEEGTVLVGKNDGFYEFDHQEATEHDDHDHLIFGWFAPHKA